MTDLSITAASVLAGSGSGQVWGTAGTTIAAGKTVYLDANSLYQLADSDSGTALVRTPVGIALNSASNGQPLAVLTNGPIAIGATVVAGQTYMQSETPGGIQPYADLGSGEYTCIIGVATSTTQINVAIKASGIAL